MSQAPLRFRRFAIHAAALLAGAGAAPLDLGCSSSSSAAGSDGGTEPGSDGGGARDSGHSRDAASANDSGRPATDTGLASESGPSPGIDSGSGTDAGAPADAGPHKDAQSGIDAARDAPPAADYCTTASGALAWTVDVTPTASSLALKDLVIGPTGDVVLADNSGGKAFEQRRWDRTGTSLSVHQDLLGSYTGMATSNLFMDSSNGAFYGMLFTGLASGTNSQADLVFSKVAASGTAVFATQALQSLPTSQGTPDVVLFNAGGDSGGGLHGAFLSTGPQYFAPAVYCWGSTGSDVGPSAQTLTATLGPQDFEWPTPGEGLAVTKPLTTTTNFGCSGGSVTVPAAGGLLLGGFDAVGNCQWNKLLAVPTASLIAYDFHVGDGGALGLAIVYAGTINLGSESFTSTGTSSLAVAQFSSSGTLAWANNYTGAGSAFTVGDVRINEAGVTVVSAGYKGTVALGSGTLRSSDNTFVAELSATGAVNWVKTVAVTSPGVLRATINTCGVAVATNSPSVNLGSGPLSSTNGSGVASIGVATLGL